MDADPPPQGVKVARRNTGYWIGSKRLEGDAFGNLSFDVRREGDRLTVSVAEDDRPPQTIVSALEQGRDAFLAYVDAMYRDTCLDAATHRKFC